MNRTIAAFVVSTLACAAVPSMADDFIVQFSGPNLPEKVVSYINIERVSAGECAHSCVLTSKEFTFQRGENGTAARGFDLPDDATRVCAHISTDVVIKSARYFATRQKSVSIGPSENFGHYNGEKYKDFGGDHWVYFACTPIKADAGAGLALVITLK
jgi:hypothetical protein